jgi:hypothetical protein
MPSSGLVCRDIARTTPTVPWTSTAVCLLHSWVCSTLLAQHCNPLKHTQGSLGASEPSPASHLSHLGLYVTDIRGRALLGKDPQGLQKHSGKYPEQLLRAAILPHLCAS